MNKIGMHIHCLTSEVFEAVKLLKPLGVVILNPTPQWIKDVRPYTNYIGVRKFEDGVPFWDRNPEGWADSIASMCGDALELIDGAIVYNEPMPQGHDNPDHFPLFDDWQARIINRLQDTHGLDALAFPFGTGQFTAAEDRVRLDVAFPQSCEVCKIISPHDYDWPNIWKSEGWRAMRWLAWLDDIEGAGYGRKEVIISEWGLTQATYGGPDIGWRSGVSQEDYLNQMSEYDARLCAMPEVRFFTPFDWGGSGAYGWDTFEHVLPDDNSVVQSIFSIQCPEVPPEPPEPNGGSNVKVFNKDGVELTGTDADNLVAYYGMGVVTPSGLKEGDHYYAIVAFREKWDSSSFIFRASDINGNPIINPDETLDRSKPHRAWWWPSVCEDSNRIETPYPTDYYPCADLGGFNVNGEGGSGMGAFHPPHTPGPYEAWVRQPTIKSDRATGGGMIEMTNHNHMDVEWKEEIYGGNGESPNGGKEMWKETSRTFTAGASGIRMHFTGGNLFDTRGNLTCGGWEIPEPVEPSIPEATAFFDTTYTENENRTYVAWIYHMNTGEQLSEKVSCDFGPDKRGIYDVYLEWQTDGNGEEPPEPPPPPSEMEGSVSDLLDELESQLLGLDTDAILATISQIRTLLWG